MLDSHLCQRAALLTLTLFLLCPAAAAEETWVVGYPGKDAPYIHSSNGEMMGIDVRLIRAIVAEAGANVRFQYLAPADQEEALRSGQVDLLIRVRGAPANFDRWQMVGPVRTTQTVLVGHKSYGLDDWSQRADLHGIYVATVEGRPYPEWFDNDLSIKKIATVDYRRALKKLMGSANLAIGREAALARAAMQQGLFDELHALEKPIEVTPEYVAFPSHAESGWGGFNDSDKRPDHRRFRQALDKLTVDGALRRIQERTASFPRITR